MASDYQASRVRGLQPPEALAHGLLLAGKQLDPATARALEDALAEIPLEEAVNAGSDSGAAARESVAGAADGAGCEGAAEDTGREGESAAAEDAGNRTPTSGSR